jgi:MFS family permease
MAGALGPAYRRLWQASAASNLADGIAMVGGALVAVQLTRSGTLVAAVHVALTLPWLLLALHAGALADRYDRRSLLLGASAGRAAGFAVVGGLVLADALSLPALYAVVFVLGAGEVLFDTTSQSIVPSLVPRERFAAANGRLVAAQQVMNQFVGAPLAGVLAATLVAGVFLGPAALYAFALVILLRLPRSPRPARVAGSTMRAEIAEGLGYLVRHRALRTLAVLAGLLNLANAAYFAVFVLFVVGPESPMGLPEVAYGILAALLAAGAVAGSLIAERVELRLGPTRLLVISLALIGLLLSVPILTTNPGAIAIMAFLVGSQAMLANVTLVSARQRIVPGHLLGRVNAAYRFIGQGIAPVGALLGGALTDLAGLRIVFAVAVTVQLLAVINAARQLSDDQLAPTQSPAA